MKFRTVVCAAAIMAGCASTAPSPEVKSQLAPTGELRVAVLTSNPIIHRTTPGLGRELAADAGVPAKLIEYAAVNKLPPSLFSPDVLCGRHDIVVTMDKEDQFGMRVHRVGGVGAVWPFRRYRLNTPTPVVRPNG